MQGFRVPQYKLFTFISKLRRRFRRVGVIFSLRIIKEALLGWILLFVGFSPGFRTGPADVGAVRRDLVLRPLGSLLQ